MSATLPVARPDLELSGAAVRRATRRAAAARAGTTLWTRLGDTVGTLTSIGVGVAIAGGGLASLRGDIATAPLVPAGTALPAPLAAAVAAVLAVAALLVLLDRLGPVSATPAAAAWWLPLAARRRGLLAGDLARTTAAVVGTAVVLALPPALALPGRTTAGGVLTTLGAAAGLAAAAVGGTALLQTRGLGGRLGGVAGAVAVLAAVAAAAAGTAGALGAGIPVPALPAVPAWTAAVLAAAAALLLASAVLGLDRLDAGRLRASGVTAQFATASFLSLDTRDLGRALSSRPRAPRRSRRFRRVRGPVGAVVAGDLVALARGRWQLGQLAAAVAVPVLVARTAGLGRLPVAVWLGCLAGWALAAVAAGAPGREAQAAPELDRLLPLAAAEVLRARLVLPLVLTAGVCAATGVLVGLGTAEPVLWSLLGLAAGPAWAAAALRGAYRPEPNWAGPVMTTPFGPSPVGVGATLVQGPDVGVVGSLPLLVALLRGAPTPGLVTAQALLSVALAAGAVALAARRRR